MIKLVFAIMLTTIETVAAAVERSFMYGIVSAQNI